MWLLLAHVILFLNVVTGARVFVPGAGNARKFNGDHQHRQYVEITPHCQSEANPFDTANVTIALWFRTDYHSPVDQTLFGYAFDQGPMMSLGRDGRTLYRGLSTYPEGSCQNWDDRMHTNLIDGQWHHMALSAGRGFYAVYADGRILARCAGDTPAVVRGARLFLGLFDPDIYSSNTVAFTGEMDDVRVYRRLLRDEADLQANVMERPPTPAELAQDMLLALDFDDDVDDDKIVNKVDLPALISVGGGLQQRSPSLIPSTAPLLGKAANATLVIASVQDGSNAPAVTRQLLVSTPRFGESRDVESIADIRINEIVAASPNSGIVSIGGVALTNNLVLSSIVNASLVFTPVAGVVGVGLIRVHATITAGNVTQDAVIVLSSRANRHPVAGSAGMASQFDGVDDFFMADRLAWPQKWANVSGVLTKGLSAITIEFWAWINKDCMGDRAVFALGGNTEKAVESWLDSFNGLRRSGRWYVTLPDESGQVRWRVGNNDYAADITKYYDGWAHYAFVHDCVEGDQLAMYVNGVQVLTATHPHNGMQEGLLDFNHFTVGTWTFWSEVYHKGIVDDFRIWNYSRSEAEIVRDMNTQLTGAEPNLFSYWTFDDTKPNDDILDRTGHGNDLRPGGCVSCEPRFYCQPYRSVPGPPLDSNSCIPSAKDVTSPYYRTQTCFGGTHCFRGEERASTHPARVMSEAPIGGYAFEQVGSGGDPINIVLNGTDPDGDPLSVSILQNPDHGLWLYDAGSGNWAPFPTAPFTLPVGVTRVRVLSNVGDGGHPFTTLRYAVRDAFALSAPILVQVQLLCPGGAYLNQAARRCFPCGPGAYMPEANTAPACTRCPVNHAQAADGQRACTRCVPGLTFTTEPGSASCLACNASSENINPTRITLSRSFCSMELVTDNVVAESGGLRSVLDFAALLPDGTKPDDARILLSTIPKHGKLFQLDPNGALQDDFYDYVVSSVQVEEQYVVRVVEATAWLPDRSYNATIGPPDVLRSGSSPLAWAPFDKDNGVAQLTVAYDRAVYVTGIVVHENIGGGAVTLIEAQKPLGDWSVVWSGDPLPIGLTVMRQWQPTICPTTFKTDTLRLTMNSLRTAGRNELDAIQLLGAVELSKSRNLIVRNPDLAVAYVPPSGVPLGYSFTDSVSYQIQSCHGGDILLAGVQNLAVKLGRIDVEEMTASAAVIWAAAVTAFVGLVTCLLSVVAIVAMRMQPVIRASSVVFMIIMVLGMAAGFVVLLLSSVNAAAPELLDKFCMIRAFIFSFSFVLIMGSIMVKTGRLVLIFNLSKGPRSLKATNAHLALILVGLVLVDFAILTGGGTSPLLVDTNHISNTSRYRTCSGRGPAADALIAVSIGYKAILVVVGLALGVLARNVPSTFNEVKALSFMTYTIATNSVIYLVVDGVVKNPNTSLILITFSLSVSLFSAWINLVGYKFWVVLFRPEMNNVTVPTGRDVPGVTQNHDLQSKNSRLITIFKPTNVGTNFGGGRPNMSDNNDSSGNY